ncbi:VOC family protein [Granulicella arctica]|uniref:Catechol 2,3-dioxygenase-like lactoylglutathione lyase family enzyme n=1 Tax=Granulicella arctica TaxID=940613 RepID=A0A7Y9PEH9_9BACT|nr:VOC family protein [Granulicella arctica]NYF78442.1 catechol 2,3-dioxygenase-like lactoylglutathione lyase family enzyme [Granulicella arctica]
MLKRWINRATILCFALLMPGVSLAKKSAEAQQLPPFNGIAHVAIRVRDLDASRSFYQKLGFDEAFTLSKNGAVYESFIKINDQQFIELYPLDEKNTQIGFLHLCFEGADLDAINKEYLSRGLTPNAVRKAGAGNLLFTMEGPEGQNIEYTQYMPGSLHSNNIGKNLGADRIADSMVLVSLAMNDMAVASDFYRKQLRFTASPHNPMLFDLPGTSGDQVEIVSSNLGRKARVVFHTTDLHKAEQHLHKQHLPFTKARGVLTIIDPDGNLLLVQSR